VIGIVGGWPAGDLLASDRDRRRLTHGNSSTHSRPRAGRDVIIGFDAEHYVEGHHESVSSRRDMEELFEKMGLAERAVHEGWGIAAPDEDTEYFIQAFAAGRATAH
jgi:hypothetical protein